jgi:hypothetical protein
MADWPTLAALKETLDVTSDDWDSAHHLEGVRQSAIAQVKLDVGDWNEAIDVPDDSLARAAHLLAVRIARAPSQDGRSSEAARTDPDYHRLLKGHRRRFGIG